MKPTIGCLRMLVLIIGVVCFAGGVSAQKPPPEYIQFSPSATKGALYYPDPTKYPNPTIGVIIMHRNSNYLSHLGTRELPDRGFVALGMNPRCDNNEALCRPWENNALDVRSGVLELKKRGLQKIILFGHSGGGPTMSFYQAVAEKGVAFCQNPSNGEPRCTGQ